METNSEADRIMTFNFFKIDLKTEQGSEPPFYMMRTNNIKEGHLEDGIIISNFVEKNGTSYHFLIKRQEKRYDRINVYGTLHESINVSDIFKMSEVPK